MTTINKNKDQKDLKKLSNAKSNEIKQAILINPGYQSDRIELNSKALP